jgi:hypothetical protein
MRESSSNSSLVDRDDVLMVSAGNGTLTPTTGAEAGSRPESGGGEALGGKIADSDTSRLTHLLSDWEKQCSDWSTRERFSAGKRRSSLGDVVSRDLTEGHVVSRERKALSCAKLCMI